jgi:signal transduction histidine kinase/ActR/RegA family two-component response regulator
LIHGSPESTLSYSNSLKRLVASGDRDGLLEEELRIAQSVAVVKQLPMVLFGNGLGALIGSLSIKDSTPWPFMLVGTMWMLLIPVFTGYWKLRGRPRPLTVSRRRIDGLTIYSGALGMIWASSMLFYLPRVPFDTLAFLTTGCAFLAAGSAAALYVVPKASAAYSTPIFVAGIYVTATFPHGAWLLLTLLLMLMACGVAWITYANWNSFLAMSKVTTERTQLLTDAKAAIMARNQFLENVSHEIRTPLTTVLGYTRLLMAQEAKMSLEHREALNYLDVSVISLLTTIDALLDVTKLNAGQLPLQEGAYDPRQLMEQTLKVMHRSAREKEIDLDFDCNAEVPQRLLGDAERVRQIVLNLLSNAVKFTNAGHVGLTLTCEYPPPSLGSEKMLCIAVRDTGIGIDASKRAFVFHSFYQVDGSSTRRHGGMGLGLTVSRMLANLMKGGLDFESDGVSGSVFKCWIPLKPHHAVAPPAEPLDAGTHTEPWQVLVVDDDVYIRHYLLALLSAAGWIVQLCESGEAAISACSTQVFDLILMDIQMPAMTGIDASKIIWAGEVNAATPILAITGYLSTDRIAELREAGLVHYLGKPLVPEELISKARHSVMTSIRVNGRRTTSTT